MLAISGGSFHKIKYDSDMNHVRFWMLFSYLAGYKAATNRRAHVVFNVAFG